MPKQSVKVVIRTRPTPNFCSKNLQIDPINSVSAAIQRLTSIFDDLERDCSHPEISLRWTHQQCARVMEVQIR